MDRVRKGISLSNRFSFLWGLGMFTLIAMFARPIASIFSGDAEVVSAIVLYARTAAAGYCAYAVFVITSHVLNVLHRPLRASALAIGQAFVLTVPMAWAGNRIAGLDGMFVGIGASYLLAGLVSLFVLRRVLSRLEERG